MLLPTLHCLHLFLAVLWAGGTIFVGLVIYPLLARVTPEEGAALFARLKRPIAAGLGSAAGVTYLLGIARAWAGGGLTRWSDLLSPYGMMVIGAVIVMMAIEHVGGRFRRQLPDILNDPDRARLLARRTGLAQVALLAVLIGVMAAMGLALL